MSEAWEEALPQHAVSVSRREAKESICLALLI